MNSLCIGCNKSLRWWQKKGPPNTSWHRRCGISWLKGNDVASKHCALMNEEHKLLTPYELYWAGNANFPEITTKNMKIVRKKIKEAAILHGIIVEGVLDSNDEDTVIISRNG